jgi:hypothetical protein
VNNALTKPLPRSFASSYNLLFGKVPVVKRTLHLVYAIEPTLTLSPFVKICAGIFFICESVKYYYQAWQTKTEQGREWRSYL